MMKRRAIFLLITICLICCFLTGCNDTTSDLNSNDNVEQNGNEDLTGDSVTDDTNEPNDNDNSSNIGNEDNANGGEDDSDNKKPDTGNDNSEDNTTPTICQHADCEVINYKEKSCDEDGYTGDLYCNDCEIVVRYGEKTEKTGHNYIAHFCDNCGDFLILGKYLGEKITNVVFDSYGQKDEYVEYKELSVLENCAKLVCVKKNVEVDLFYFTVDSVSGNCYIDYYDAKKEDVDSILDNGFEKIKNGYQRLNKYKDGEWEVTVTEILILGDESTGIQTTTTEKISTKEGSYDYNYGNIDVDFGDENFVKALNLNNDTFMDEDNTLLIKYYVNDQYSSYHYFDNYSIIDDYYIGSVDANITEWYVDNTCTILFDETNFDVKEYKQNNEILTLYAKKDYFNIFVFDGIEYKYDNDDYSGISTFVDVEKKIFEAQKIEIKTNNYVGEWTEDGEIVTNFSRPTGDKLLSENHTYVLRLKPIEGYCNVIVFDKSLNKRSMYFVEIATLSGTYLSDVLLNVVQLSNSAYTNYSYSYLDDGNNYKDSDDILAYTEDYIVDNEVTIYGYYHGITVTYVSSSGTKIDVIEAGQSYTINGGETSAVAWYGIVDDEIVEYALDQVINVTNNLTLYDLVIVVTYYNDNNTFEEKLITRDEINEIKFTTTERIFDNYQFLGYRVKENVVFTETEYLGALNELMVDFNIDSVGINKVDCVYKNTTTISPTKFEKGKIISEYYIGNEYGIEEKEIPILSEDNYQYSFMPATLFKEGKEIFSNEEFGTYEIIIPKLSTYTFVYNEQTITINVKANGDGELIINDEINQSKITIDYVNERITMSVVGKSESSEYLYAASIDVNMGSVNLLEIDSLEDVNSDDVKESDVGSGYFYQYEKLGNYYVAMVEKEIYDSSYELAFYNLEKYNANYYVAQNCGIAYNLSFLENEGEYSMWVGKSSAEAEFNLPKGNVDFKEGDFQIVTAYIQNEKALILNNDGTFTYGNEHGNYYYDESKRIYILYRQTSGSEKVFVYEIKNGEDIFYEIN